MEYPASPETPGGDDAWPPGKTFIQLTQAQRRAAIERAAAQFQDELTRNAAAISDVLNQPLEEQETRS